MEGGGAVRTFVNDNTSWEAGELLHYAIAWDKDGFDGGKTLALYINGQEKGNYNGTFDFGDMVLDNFRMVVNNKEFVFDNVKVYNYAKTDFSDRFNEGGSLLCPEIELIYPKDNFTSSDLTPTFKWKAYNMPGRPIHYEIKLADNKEMMNAVVFNSKKNTAGFSQKPPLANMSPGFYTVFEKLQPKNYYWCVRAWDGKNYNVESEVRELILSQ